MQISEITEAPVLLWNLYFRRSPIKKMTKILSPTIDSRLSFIILVIDLVRTRKVSLLNSPPL